MTDELKKALLESNIQCINEYDGKFVFLLDEIQEIETSNETPFLFLPVLLAKVLSDNKLKTLVFVCCNASSSYGMNLPPSLAESNLFWLEITNYGYFVVGNGGY